MNGVQGKHMVDISMDAKQDLNDMFILAFGGAVFDVHFKKSNFGRESEQDGS